MKKLLFVTMLFGCMSTFADIWLASGDSISITSKNIGQKVYCDSVSTEPRDNICYIEQNGNFRIVDAYGAVLISHREIDHALYSLDKFIKSDTCTKNTFESCRVRQVGSSYGVYVGKYLAVTHSQIEHAEYTASRIRNIGGCR